MIHLDIQNNSTVKHLYRRSDLVSLAERICAGEGLQGDAELSILFCDDPFIQELNHQYRSKNEPTDVLSFQQENLAYAETQVLGDIVISLETVDRFCNRDRVAMRNELRLLLCHGLLHLLGHTHAQKTDRSAMLEKQAQYLQVEVEDAWHS